MSVFNALVTNEDEAVMPARRYLSPPRLPLDCVNSAFSFLGLNLSITSANELRHPNSGSFNWGKSSSKVPTYVILREKDHSAGVSSQRKPTANFTIRRIRRKPAQRTTSRKAS